MAGPRLLPTRRIEQEGVREVEAFFVEHDCVVQRVAGENDFGKDLYVDLTQDARLTGVTFAAQVKSGTSYRVPGGYRIPIGQHEECWRDSTIPVLGFVYDPESKGLYWINVTESLRDQPSPTSRVLVPVANRLTAEVLPALERSVREASHGQHPLVGVWADDTRSAQQAVWDCLGVGRRDARVLRGLRAAVSHFRGDLLRDAVAVLSHVTRAHLKNGRRVGLRNQIGIGSGIDFAARL